MRLRPKLLNELTEEPNRLIAAASGGAHGLLDLHESRLEQSDAAVAGGAVRHRLTHAGGDLQLLLHEHRDPSPPRTTADALSLAREVQVKGGPFLDPDPNAVAVDISDGSDRESSCTAKTPSITA